MEGTLAVLAAARAAGTARRVVLTSSTAAILKRLVPDGHVYNEASWNDVEELAQRKLWYSIAKTKQERAAWDWVEAEKPGFDLVAICPTMIAGPTRTPVLNASLENVRDLCDGSSPKIRNFNMPWIHVSDVAEAHVAAADTPAASGRYMLLACWEPLAHACAAIGALGIPGLTVATEVDLAPGEAPAPLSAFDSSRVERELLGGRKLLGLERCMRDSVESLIAWGHLKAAAPGK